MIESRIKEVIEFYCSECGDNVGQMVHCPSCAAKEDCLKGKHRVMLTHARLGDELERESASTVTRCST